MNYRIILTCLKFDGTTTQTVDNSSNPFSEDEKENYIKRVLIKFYQTNGVNISQFAPLAFYKIVETSSNPNTFIDNEIVQIK